MCFILTCGEHEFSSRLQGYENVTCQCHNCGNWSASVIKRHPWFTVCFIPVLPLSLHAYEVVVCPVCNFAQPLKNRPDVMNQHPNAGNQGNQVPLQNYNQGNGPPPGWGGGPGGGPGHPPQPGPGQKTNEQMRYG